MKIYIDNYNIDDLPKKMKNLSKHLMNKTNESDIYPSYCYNYKRFNYLDFVFGYNRDGVYYDFKNKNNFDLRRSNVSVYHSYHKNIVNKYDVIEYIHGHSVTMGQDANIMKNPIWKIKENEKEYLLMYCEKETICKLCPSSYQKILDYEATINKKMTWYKCLNGYIQSHNNVDSKVYYIHQIITGCYGNGQGTKNISVDHIDQNPLNNTFENLRIATRKEQEQNSKGIKTGTKRERKSSARPLPDGISQDMLRKYVVYYHEWLDKEQTREREFFKVETHPKLDKPWITTKSNKVSITEKLVQANKIVDDLENDIYPVKEEPKLPTYVSLLIFREKPHLVYEKRVNGKRLNLKMVLPDEYDLDEQLIVLNDKIKAKYENISLFEGDKQESDMLNKFKYTLFIDLDDTYKHIKYVIFYISRYRKHKHIIFLDDFITQKQAVTKAEEFLSEKITPEYYDKVKDDLFFENGDYELDYIYSQNRGFLLTDCKYLEIVSTYCNILTIGCAS